MRKKLLLILSFVLSLSVLLLVGCTESSDLHFHEYNGGYKFNEEMHWLECNCGYLKKKEHTGGTATCTQKAVCTVCGNSYGELSKCSYTLLKSDNTSHWYECVCGKKSTVEKHIGDGNCLSAICSVCGKDYTSSFEHVYVDGECTVCGTSDVLVYTLINNGTEYCVSDNGSYKAIDVVIPATYKGKPVTRMTGFYDTHFTSVKIPEGMREIGPMVLYLSLVREVEIPNSVTYIGSGAFQACRDLQYNVKDGLKYLGNESNKYHALIDMEEGTTTATVDDACKVIVGGEMESNFTSLRSIKLGKNVISICENAFAYCRYLNSITISKSVRLIERRAFAECYNLTSIKIPSSVTYIGDEAFYECNYLASVTFEENSKLTHIGDNAFLCCGFESIKIPSSVTYIGAFAFEGIELEEVIFEENSKLESIGSHAFSTNSFTSIKIPSSVTYIGDNAFRECHNLQQVTFDINSKLVSIGNKAFDYCEQLVDIEFGGTIAVWNTVAKGSDWNSDVPATHVQCEDGQVQLT